MTTTSELVTRTPVPAWANDAIAVRGVENQTAGDDTWDLSVDGRHVGCMYDDGSGYQFAEDITTADLSGALLA